MDKFQLQAIHNLLWEVSELLGRDIAGAMIAGDFKRMGKYQRMLQNTIGAAEVIRRELDEMKEEQQ